MLKEIQENIKNNNMSFMLNGIQFVCVSKGKGIFVYQGNHKSTFPDTMEASLLIVDEQTIAFNKFRFPKEEWEDIVTPLEVSKKMELEIEKIISKKAHNLTPDKSVLQENHLNIITKKAWESAVHGELCTDIDFCQYTLLEPESCYEILCGLKDLEKYAETIYKDIKQDLLVQITINHLAADKAKEYEKRYEIGMYQALLTSGASQVSLLMERNGNKAEEKISVSSLMRILLFAEYQGSTISYWLFPTEKKGKAVYEQLGIDRLGRLQLDDIKEIQYRKKTIWTKPEA